MHNSCITNAAFGNQAQAIQLTWNLAITGSFLVLAGSGPGAWCVEGRRTA